MTVQELYAQIGGDYESAKRILMMDKMISRFIVKLLDDRCCEKLLDAGERMDGQGLFEAAHALKGVCANLGLMALSQAAGDITEEFRPGKERTMSDAEVSERLAWIKTRYESIVEGIRAFSAEQ